MPTNPMNELRVHLVNQIDDHKSSIETHTLEINKLETMLAKFDRAFPDVQANAPTPRRKPGPKPGSKRSVTTKGKPGPKPKANVKTPRKGRNLRAVEGRRAVAQNLRPSIKVSIATVMGEDTVNATEIYERLKVRGWLPNASDPRGYISYTLSKNSDLFTRTQRGVYSLSVKGKALLVNNDTTAPVNAEASETDKTLSEAGFLPQESASN